MEYKRSKHFRLPYYNYASSNLYFVTICTHDWEKRLFGQIVNGEMVLSGAGKCAEESLQIIPSVAKYASIDTYMIMPDHIHAIIAINNPDEPGEVLKLEFAVRKKSLSRVVGNFKSAVTTKIRALCKDPTITVWQSRFFDRIVRNERELNAIRQYIINNPMQWEVDKNRPDNLLM
jgi:REP element-mobilizing transposase RayT